MRRKTSPHPLAPRGASRPLRPAAVAFVFKGLPTVACLAALGCSTPTLEVIAADPVTTKAVSAPAPAPSASATPYIEPDPHDIDGDIAVVMPAPVPSAKKVAPKPHP